MAEIGKNSPAERAITSEIRKKSKKVGYDPKIHTNWCDLPMEMREMCIRKMDVQARFQMRNTSHIERILVDLEKLNFDQVEFHIYYNIEVLFWKKSSQEKPDFHFRALRNTKEYKNVLWKSAELMKMSRIENLRIGYEDSYSEAPEAFRRLAPFRIKKISCDCARDSDVWRPEIFFLNNSEERIEEFQLERTQFETFQFDGLLNAKVPKLAKIRFYKLPDGIIEYMKKWIQDDVEIGTELQCEILDGYKLNWLIKAFHSRKISSKHQIHRFRTDNPSKELTLSITHYQDKNLSKATWQMIPATPRKSTPMRAAKRKSSD